MRIVIAEDSALLRGGIERILIDAGHEVVGSVADVEIGRRVQQSDGWQAVVKDGGKNRVLGTGLSKDRAYGVVTKWYHYGEVPQAKSDKTASA